MRIEWGGHAHRAGRFAAPCRSIGAETIAVCLACVMVLVLIADAAAQPRDRIIAERFGHQETARDGRWRMVPTRDARGEPAAQDWRAPQRRQHRSGATRHHQVGSGETLFRIARRYGVTVEALQRANGIDDPTTLRIGRSLVIPADAQPRHAEPPRRAAPGPRRRTTEGWRERDEEPDWSEQRWRRPPASDRRASPEDRPERGWHDRDRRDPGGLRALARTMSEPASSRRGEMPAGYTFFAQLVGADLKVNDMLRGWLREDARGRRVSAELDLDIIYGRGPEADRDRFYLPYIRTGPRLSGSGKRYALARGMPPAGNPFVVQLQASLIELHNRAVDLLIERHLASDRSRYCEGDCSNAELARSLPEAKRLLLFKDARETVIHYYHRVIIDDFLPRLIGPERAQDIISNGRDLFFPEGFRDGEFDAVKQPFIPYEFALAAYQFSASQITSAYVMRDGQRARRFDPAALAANRPARERLRADDLADWRYFVDILPEPPDGFNFAAGIDPFVASSRGAPGTASAILIAGARAGLPSGQQVAEKLLPKLRKRGLLYLWQPRSTGRGTDDAIWRRYVLPPDRPTRETLGRGGTPLWYYVLQEAERLGGANGFGHDAQAYALSARTASARYAAAGRDRIRRDSDVRPGGSHSLGPVGGTIVGEVLVGLAEHYALKTGKGLRFQPPIGASAYGERFRFGLTRARASGGELGERYLLRNLLIDAGASIALD